MMLDTILHRLLVLLPELEESENYVLARSVREVIAIIESEQAPPPRAAEIGRDAA